MTRISDLDDAACLRRAARGDEAAFAQLYDRLAPMILLRLRRRCADADLVADVLQETFIMAWRAADSWDGRGDVAAWVWVIAARRLVDGYRRQDVRLRAANAVPAGRETPVPSVEDQIVDGLLPGPLEVAVRSLSPELQAVLQVTVLDGMTTREAAVMLGIPEGTVKTRAWRARIALREALA